MLASVSDELATRAAKRTPGASQRTADTMLVAAAAKVSGTAGTVLDVLEKHALGHYAEGLQQYLAIRHGDVESARATFEKLRHAASAIGGAALAEPPGARARLYRLARELSEHGEGKPATPAKSGTLPWYRPRTTPEATVVRLRDGVGDRELLELRYARELSLPEIAFVLGEDRAALTTRLEAAVEKARGLAGDADLPTALLEAFALEKLDAAIASRGTELPPVPAGTVVDDRYELEKHVGSGGFADVYRARDVAVPGHTVALKLLKRRASSDAEKDDALRELRLIAAVFHPSIVQFKDHGWHDGRFWFVMPWYQGEALEQRIEREPLSRAEARRVFVPLARALATMHASGVRHQDVKPDNIFLAELEGFAGADVLPVLLDLGVAAKDAELVLAGTPTYFAPEVAAQFAHNEAEMAPIGPAADVFALALSLRNALEPWTQPEVAAGAVERFIAHRAVEVPEPPTSGDLRYLDKHFRRWMAKDPSKRPTATELAEELSILTLPEERRAQRLRQLRLFGPIVLALLVIFGVVFYELQRRSTLHRDKAVAAEQRTEAALADLEDAAEEQAALESRISEAEDRIAGEALSRAELASQLAEAEGRLSVTEDRLSARTRLLREARKALESAEETAELATARAATLEGERDSARSERDEARSERDAARRSLETAEERLRQRTSELEAARRALAAAERERDQAVTERDELRTRLATAERETQRAEQARQRAETQRDQAQQARERAETERDSLRQDNRRLERELRTAERGTSARNDTPATMVTVPTTMVTPTMRERPGVRID